MENSKQLLRDAQGLVCVYASSFGEIYQEADTFGCGTQSKIRMWTMDSVEIDPMHNHRRF